MINQHADIPASVLIERIEALAALAIDADIGGFLLERPERLEVLVAALEAVRVDYPGERLTLEVFVDPDDGDRFFALTIWEPAGTPLDQGEARYERFIEHWVSNPALRSSSIAVCLKYAG